MTTYGYAAYQARQRATEIEALDPREMFVEALQQEHSELEQKTVPFYDWAVRIPEPKSGTLDFRRFPFQVELYREGQADQDIVIQKSTQVGVSAFLVRWTMFWADVRGLTALYVFPKQKQLYDFSDSRIRPLVLGSEYLRSRVPGVHVQNKGLKQIGLGFVYFRGSESEDDLNSVDADVLALDEYDSLKQDNIPDAEKRVGASDVGYVRRIGNPTFPDYGINKKYLESDQRRWRVKCRACGDWQALDFWENVDMARAIVVCRSCAKPLDVGKGEWVADHPDRGTRGYHITRLMVPHQNIQALVDESKNRDLYARKVFHNKSLGEPFAEEEGRLSPAALAAAERPYTMVPGHLDGGELVTMGVDVASVRSLNVRISIHNSDDTKGALWIGTVDSFDALGTLMDRYNVKMCGIDHMPEHRLARSFAERYAGRVYLVRYTGGTATKVLDVDEEMRVATVRRTEAIDATMNMIREQRNQLPLDRPEDYNANMMAALRYVEKDDIGKIVVGYRNTGPDDYLHAEVFDLIATELWWVRMSVADAEREVFQPLDNMLEFQRSPLAEPQEGDKADYSPGFRHDDYSAGPGDDWDD